MIISEDSRRSSKSSEDVWSINASSLPVLFTAKIRDREELIFIYSFYTWFSFFIWVWVNIFLEIVSSKMAAAHIFQSGMRTWPSSVSRREIEVFDLWDSRLRRESWQVYIAYMQFSLFCYMYMYLLYSSWKLMQLLGFLYYFNTFWSSRFLSRYSWQGCSMSQLPQSHENREWII